MVCGFAFHGDETLLIKKKRGPDVVRGKLNGIGGHIEKSRGETPIQAMVREFAEEAGAATREDLWVRFVEFHFDGGCVHYFFYDGDPPQVRTMTDESVFWTSRFTVQEALVRDLTWLIPLARHIRGTSIEVPIVIREETTELATERI